MTNWFTRLRALALCVGKPVVKHSELECTSAEVASTTAKDKHKKVTTGKVNETSDGLSASEPASSIDGTMSNSITQSLCGDASRTSSQAEFAELQRRCAELEEQRRSDEELIEGMAAQCAKFQEIVQKASSDKIKLEAQLSHQKRICRVTQEKRQEESVKVEKLKQRVAELEGRIAAVASDGTSQQVVEVLQAELAEARASAADMESQLQGVTGELASIQRDMWNQRLELLQAQAALATQQPQHYSSGSRDAEVIQCGRHSRPALTRNSQS